MHAIFLFLSSNFIMSLQSLFLELVSSKSMLLISDHYEIVCKYLGYSVLKSTLVNSNFLRDNFISILYILGHCLCTYSMKDKISAKLVWCCKNNRKRWHKAFLCLCPWTPSHSHPQRLPQHPTLTTATSHASTCIYCHLCSHYCLG